MDWLSICALVVSFVGVVVAVWQANISRKQLAAAEQTERRTENALTEIRNVTQETRRETGEIRSSIEQRINRIVDQKLDGERSSQETVSQMFGGLGRMLTQSFEQSMAKQRDAVPPTNPQAEPIEDDGSSASDKTQSGN